MIARRGSAVALGDKRRVAGRVAERLVAFGDEPIRLERLRALLADEVVRVPRLPRHHASIEIDVGVGVDLATHLAERAGVAADAALAAAGADL